MLVNSRELGKILLDLLTGLGFRDEGIGLRLSIY